jgi:hypothetical protein
MQQFKSGFAQRTQVYGIIASVTLLVVSVLCESLVLGAVGVLSLGIHVTAKR